MYISCPSFFNIRYNLRWGKKSAVQKAGTSGISGRLDVND